MCVRCLPLRLFLLFLWVFCLACSANMSMALQLDWVNVGDPGNLEDPILQKDGTSGIGSVNYRFRMSKYELTNAQYAEFLNAVAVTDSHSLYHFKMDLLFGGITRTGASGSYSYTTKPNMDNKPVNFLSFFDAARFANWMHNGQPTGLQDSTTTEDGAYTFPDQDESVHANSDSDHPTTDEDVGTRNPGARFFIPDEHEWHKAAYYEPGAVTGDGDEWWAFPLRTDAQPIKATADAFGNVSNPSPLTANYFKQSDWNGTSGTGNVVTVGSAGGFSYYGAADMGGNLFEWVEADPTKPDPHNAGRYNVLSGAFDTGGAHMHQSDRNAYGNPANPFPHNFVRKDVGIRFAASITADFDGNGDVDGDDLADWASAFGIDGGGDADFDTDTDGADLLAWQRQFDGGEEIIEDISAGQAVPEPSGGILALLTISGFLMRRTHLLDSSTSYRTVA